LSEEPKLGYNIKDMPKTKSKNRYMLIDGNALIHRGFHAIPALNTKNGEPTNAVYGFTMILLRAIKELKPTHIACSFDLAGPTFRHEEYLDYKATRVKAAQELYDQIPRVKEVVRALNIPIFEIKGFEADDVLGTLATHICKEHSSDCEVMIVTGDLDSLQLVNDCVKIYTLRKGLTDTAVYDRAAVLERYGLTPEQMIDYRALRGDASDNIKGVPGIGEKTAVQLIQDFGSIDDLYEKIKAGASLVEKKIKPRIVQLLVDNEAAARQSYRLSQIVLDVKLDINIPAYEFTRKNLSLTLKLFQDLEFRSLVDKLPKNYIGAKAALGEEIEVDTTDEEPKKEVSEIGKQNYQLIDSAEKLDGVLKKLSSQKFFAIDTETDQLNPISAKIIGASISFTDGEAYYITSDVVEGSAALKKIIENNKVGKVGHNIKYDLLTLGNSDIKLDGPFFDTMVASYLLAAGTRQHGLAACAFNELGYQMQPIEELIGKGKNQISMADVEVKKVSWYAAEDADITWRLKEIYEPRLKQEKLTKIFQDIEMPLIPVLANMEHNGIKLDTELVRELSQRAEKEISELETDVYELAGEEFNLHSPKQLGEILYGKLNLTAGKKNKTGLSTAAGELEKLVDEHEIIPKILSYRELTKLQSTYLQPLPELVNPKTGRLHTNYNQTIAATGRLSSIDPNLQNIPIRGDGLGSEIRKAFVAEPGYKLMSIDYSQMELRIIAHLSGDKNMMRVFKNDEDIHTNTATAIFDVSPDKVTGDMRRDAKTINFGILYGLSSFGLASRINAVSRTNAKEFIDKYFEAYPDVKAYIENVKAEVNETGMVKNQLGRIRKFPEIRSSQYFIRAGAERAAVNFPIQSLQADVLKIAMINIFKEIAGKDEEIRMLLQVHDELVFEVKQTKIDYWVKKIKPLMVDALKLLVPVTAEAKVGPNWGEMEKI
jgi:DNA polymerase I